MKIDTYGNIEITIEELNFLHGKDPDTYQYVSHYIKLILNDKFGKYSPLGGSYETTDRERKSNS